MTIIEALKINRHDNLLVALSNLIYFDYETSPYEHFAFYWSDHTTHYKNMLGDVYSHVEKYFVITNKLLIDRRFYEPKT